MEAPLRVVVVVAAAVAAEIRVVRAKRRSIT